MFHTFLNKRDPDWYDILSEKLLLFFYQGNTIPPPLLKLKYSHIDLHNQMQYHQIPMHAPAVSMPPSLSLWLDYNLIQHLYLTCFDKWFFLITHPNCIHYLKLVTIIASIKHLLPNFRKQLILTIWTLPKYSIAFTIPYVIGVYFCASVSINMQKILILYNVI